jgi:hypothetical protein
MNDEYRNGEGVCASALIGFAVYIGQEINTLHDFGDGLGSRLCCTTFRYRKDTRAVPGCFQERDKVGRRSSPCEQDRGALKAGLVFRLCHL